MIEAKLLRRAVFVGGVVLGASFAARATPPCPTSERLFFTLESVRVDGVEQAFEEFALGKFYLYPDDAEGDEEVERYAGSFYDPEARKQRNASLRRAP